MELEQFVLFCIELKIILGKIKLSPLEASKHLMNFKDFT